MAFGFRGEYAPLRTYTLETEPLRNAPGADFEPVAPARPWFWSVGDRWSDREDEAVPYQDPSSALMYCAAMDTLWPTIVFLAQARG